MSTQDIAVAVAPAPPGSVARTVLIDARPETVFAFLTDPRRHLVIDGSGTIRGTLEAPERLSLGATFGMRMVNPVPHKVTNTEVPRQVACAGTFASAWADSEPVGGHPGRRVLRALPRAVQSCPRTVARNARGVCPVRW